MTDYVPYEERVRRERANASVSVAASRTAHEAAVASIRDVLARLRGSGTDAYIEVLKPAGWRDRRRSRDALVVLPGRTGGPLFVIDEVLQAYRVPDAIIRRYKEGSPGTFDALVVPDGRLWEHAGGGVTSNTWQLLASSVRSFGAFETAALERVAAGLRTRLP